MNSWNVSSARPRPSSLGTRGSPSTDVGPVIDEDAAAMIRQRIEAAKQEDQLVLGMELPDEGLMPGRSYIAPHVFVTDDPKSSSCRRDLRPRFGADPRPGLRARVGTGKRRPIPPHWRRVRPKARPPHASTARIPRREPVPQPKHHGSNRGPPALRWGRHERRWIQSRRPGLPAAVCGTTGDYGKHHASRLRPRLGIKHLEPSEWRTQHVDAHRHLVPPLPPPRPRSQCIHTTTTGEADLCRKLLKQAACPSKQTWWFVEGRSWWGTERERSPQNVPSLRCTSHPWPKSFGHDNRCTPKTNAL